MAGQVANVVQVEQVMVDEPLDEIERPPSEQHLRGQRAGSGQRVAAPGVAQQHEHAGERHGPHGGVEDAVPAHVQLHGRQRDRRDLRREHVVPVDDLMQEDAVDEGPEPAIIAPRA